MRKVFNNVLAEQPGTHALFAGTHANTNRRVFRKARKMYKKAETDQKFRDWLIENWAAILEMIMGIIGLFSVKQLVESNVATYIIVDLLEKRHA